MRTRVRVLILVASAASSVPGVSTAVIPGDVQSNIGIEISDETNLLSNPTFLFGLAGWGPTRGFDALVEVRSHPEEPAHFGHIGVRLEGTGRPTLHHLASIPIDPARDYRIGTFGYGTGVEAVPLQATLSQFGSNGHSSDLVVDLTLPPAPYGHASAPIFGAGGPVPAWDAKVQFIKVRFGAQGANGRHTLNAVYLIASDRYPSSIVPPVPKQGTHEAAWDGTHLYLAAQEAGQIAKFDANLRRVGVATLVAGSAPHDLTIATSTLWTIGNGLKVVEGIDLRSMAVQKTYGILGARTGFGIAYDRESGYLWVGAGWPGADPREEPALIRMSPLDGMQQVWSTDVNGGAANIPLQPLGDSVWSLFSPDEDTSQVKRISKKDGATLATISTPLTKLYGLGTDGTFIYVSGVIGVSKIDPATNRLVATYRFRQAVGGMTRLKYENGRLWGGAQDSGHVFYLDIGKGRLIERQLATGQVKWVQPMGNGDVAVGTLFGPYLFRVRAY